MLHTLVVHGGGWDDRHAPPQEGPSKIARSRVLMTAAHALLFGLSNFPSSARSVRCLMISNLLHLRSLRSRLTHSAADSVIRLIQPIGASLLYLDERAQHCTSSEGEKLRIWSSASLFSPSLVDCLTSNFFLLLLSPHLGTAKFGSPTTGKCKTTPPRDVDWGLD
jgi:hypothetical protein